MDFPEIIMPGIRNKFNFSLFFNLETLIFIWIVDDFRNDFFVTVIGGEFSKARTYEFVVNLVQFREEASGKYSEVAVDFSDDMEDARKKIFFHKSLVYPKTDAPRWNEIVKVFNYCSN